MRLVVEVKEGKNDEFAAVYFHEINRIPECKMGTTVNIWIGAWGLSRVFKSQHFLAVKFVP